MENNENNLKPQSTGGLKLMTVFVVVLVLHVVVIGSMTTYYMLKGGSADTDLLTDKTHKGLKANPDGSLVADSTTPDASASSTTTPATTPAPDASASTAVNTATPTPAPATEQTASTDASGTLNLAAATPAIPAEPTTPTTPATTSAPATPAVATTTTPAPTNLAPPAEAPATPAPAAATTPAPTDVAQATPSTDGAPYTVKSHDSLAKIAHNNHTTVAKLKAANNLTSDKLSIGQKLVIPSKTQVATTTTPAAATATATDVATTASTSPVVADAPAPVKAAVDTTAKVTKSSSASLTKAVSDHHLYTVVKGDTLTKIAHKFKTTPSALMAANNITDPTKLSIGKKLMIPAKEAHTAKTNEPSVVQPAQVESKAKAAAQLANNQ